MECALHYIKKDDLEKMKADLKAQDPNLFFAEIQGANIQSFEEYMKETGIVFNFPRPTTNANAYLEWMRDLMWLPDASGFVFIIRQFSLMLLKDLTMKVYVVNDFPKTIFPWWDGDAEKYMVGGKKKAFIVYLVEEDLADMGESLPVPPNTPSA